MKSPVKLKLVGLDGNAWVLLGHFVSAARKCGWTQDEIDEVTKDAMSADYNHLVATLARHCVNGGKGRTR